MRILKYWSAIVFILIITSINYQTIAQGNLRNQAKPFKINIAFTSGLNYHFQYPTIFLIDRNDLASYQNPGIGLGFTGDFVYDLNNTNRVVLSLGYTKHSFTDYSFDLSFGGPYPDQKARRDKINLSYVNIGFGCGFELKKSYLENLIVIDLLSSKQSYIKPLAISYQLNFRIIEFSSTLSSLRLEPYLKVALMNYHFVKWTLNYPITSDNYFPFTIGVRANVHFYQEK